jgi:hypothetical protein
MNAPPAKGQDPADHAATTPAARNRRIEAVLRDPNLTRAEGQAVIAVVLHANGHGLAWPGQRRLRTEYRLSGPAVTDGLRKAVKGGHLADAGIGPRGVRLYRVLDAPEAPRKASASAPVSGTLNQPPARRFSAASAPVSESSAPVSPAQRASGWHETKEVNHEEPKEGNQDGPAPSTAMLCQANGNGTATANGHDKRKVSRGNDNGHDRPEAEPTDPDAAFQFALGREPTAKERISFNQAVAEARTVGAPDALIAHFVRRTPPSEGVWAGPNAARSEARRLVESWASAGLEPRRESVGAILKDLNFAADYLKQSDLPSWDAGLARNRKVLAWARREASALRAADGRAGP